MATQMRPMQRRVRRLAEAGVDEAEIAWRFRRSPRLIRQVLECSYQERPSRATTRADVVRPLERTILNWRAAGASYAEIAARFRRSPDFIRRVEVLALRRDGENVG